MNKEDMEEAITKLTAYKLQQEELKRREKWVRARCIGLGLWMAEMLREFASWGLDNTVALKAAFVAFFSARGGQ